MDWLDPVLMAAVSSRAQQYCLVPVLLVSGSCSLSSLCSVMTPEPWREECDTSVSLMAEHFTDIDSLTTCEFLHPLLHGTQENFFDDV